MNALKSVIAVFLSIVIFLVNSMHVAPQSPYPYILALTRVVERGVVAAAQNQCQLRPLPPLGRAHGAVEHEEGKPRHWTQFANNIFVPSAYSGDMCARYAGGVTLLGENQQVIVPIVEGGEAGLNIGELLSSVLSYSLNPTLVYTDMLALTSQDTPADITRFSRVLGVWAVEDTSVITGVLAAQTVTELRVDQPPGDPGGHLGDWRYIRDLNRWSAMSDYLKLNRVYTYLNESSVLRTGAGWAFPQERFGMLCSARFESGASLIPAEVLGITFMPSETLPGYRWDAWILLGHTDETERICGRVFANTFVWTDAGTAWIGLSPIFRKHFEEDYVKPKTTLWPRIQMNPNPLYPQPFPEPVMADTEIVVFIVGAVVVILILVVAYFTGPIIWVVAVAI